LKVLLSIGGWDYSTNFTSINTASGRASFAVTAISLLERYGLDGIDISWEYPANSTQADALVLLLKTLRQTLDEYEMLLYQKCHTTRYHFELTFATPGGPAEYQNLPLLEMDQYLDFWNLMAFDYTGPWSNLTGHQANLFSAGNSTTPFNTEAAVKYYVSKGIISSKIVLGNPLYGRSFNQTTGLGTAFKGSGIYDLKTLPLAGATEIYSKELGATYSWDPVKKELVSYDNIQSAQQKACWIRENQLGGAMWWKSSDDRAGNQSLISIMVESFGNSIQQSINNLDYPDSSYQNVGIFRNATCLKPANTSYSLQHPTSIWTNTSNIPKSSQSVPTSTLETITTTSSSPIVAMVPNVVGGLLDRDCTQGDSECGSTGLSCPTGICYCGLSTSGSPTCLQDLPCKGTTSCTADTDCASDEVCSKSNCCGGGRTCSCGKAICMKIALGCALGKFATTSETADALSAIADAQETRGI
jgi:chitinase